MADAAPIISPSEAVIIIAYTQNANGTLSPTPLSTTAGPVVNPVDAVRTWFFIQNPDGTLSPSSI